MPHVHTVIYDCEFEEMDMMHSVRIRALAAAVCAGLFASLMFAAEGGKFGEVFVDATVGLPIMCAALFERLGKGYKKAAHKTK